MFFIFFKGFSIFLFPARRRHSRRKYFSIPIFLHVDILQCCNSRESVRSDYSVPCKAKWVRKGLDFGLVSYKTKRPDSRLGT